MKVSLIGNNGENKRCKSKESSLRGSVINDDYFGIN